MKSIKEYELKYIPIRKNGVIKKVFAIYAQQGVTYNQLISDLTIVKANKELDKAFDPYIKYNKSVLNNGMESGVSTLQAAFNLGAVPLKNEKPTDVIRAAFYDNRVRNDSAIENGLLIPEFISSYKNCKKVLIVNPSPDMIIAYESKKMENIESYYVVNDNDLAILYSKEFKNSRFYTIDEYDVCPVVDSMLIVSRDYKVRDCYKLFKWIIKCRGNTMMFLPNAFFENDKSWVDVLKSNRCVISDITLVDKNSFNSNPRKKCIVNFIHSNVNIGESKLYLYDSIYDKKSRKIKIYIDGKEIQFNNIALSKITIIGINNNLIDKKEEKKYLKIKKEFVFSREISLSYKVYQTENGRNRLIINYDRIEAVSSEETRRGKKIGPYIERSGKNTEDLIKELNNTVINNEIYHHIRGDILKWYDEYLGVVSLKTLWLLCLDNLRMRKKYDEEFFLTLLCSSDGISDYDCFKYTDEQFEKMLANQIGVDVTDVPIKYYEQIELLYDVAKSLGYTNYNPVTQLLPKASKRMNKRQQDVRDALVHKMFCGNEELKIFEYSLGRKDYGGDYRCVAESKYLIVLIRLFTGMSLREVCALTWGDYKQIEGSEEFHFCVTKFVDDNGKIVTHIERDDIKKYRWIPVAYPLRVLLDKRKKHLLKRGIKQEDLFELPIIFVQEESIDLKKISKMMKPSSARVICKNAIDGLKLDSEIVILPDEYNEVYTDLYKYNGDIFVSNFEDKINHICGFETGEIDYILGRKTKETFWKHYCDLTDNDVQSVMAIKLNRWVSKYSALLEKGIDELPTQSRIASENIIKNGPYSTRCSYDEISIINKSDKDEKIEISVDAKHGYDIRIIEYGKE